MHMRPLITSESALSLRPALRAGSPAAAAIFRIAMAMRSLAATRLEGPSPRDGFFSTLSRCKATRASTAFHGLALLQHLIGFHLSSELHLFLRLAIPTLIPSTPLVLGVVNRLARLICKRRSVRGGRIQAFGLSRICITNPVCLDINRRYAAGRGGVLFGRVQTPSRWVSDPCSAQSNRDQSDERKHLRPVSFSSPCPINRIT